MPENSTKNRRFIQGVAVAGFLILTAMVYLNRPSYTPIADGYSLVNISASKQRYIVGKDGKKKVGERVLSYRVEGRFIVGTALRVGTPEANKGVESFRIDLDTGKVEYTPLASPAPAPASPGGR